jgi:hypothetical protein
LGQAANNGEEIVMGFKKAFGLGVAVAALLAITSAAQAGPIYSFYNITNNGSVDASADFTVEVIENADGTVSFKFMNSGDNGASITDVYFDDGTLLGIASISDSGAGVTFTQGATPPDLPGGDSLTPKFDVTAGFLADSTAPIEANGVGGGEWLMITFNLINGKTFADTIAALEGGVDLRIGIHVQSIEPGSFSDSFVTKVPDGGTTLSLLGLALTGLGMVSRRRKA